MNPIDANGNSTNASNNFLIIEILNGSMHACMLSLACQLGIDRPRRGNESTSRSLVSLHGGGGGGIPSGIPNPPIPSS